jgi:hypothetical protein
MTTSTKTKPNPQQGRMDQMQMEVDDLKSAIQTLTKQQDELFNMFATKEELEESGQPDLKLNIGELRPEQIYQGILNEVVRETIKSYGHLDHLKGSVLEEAKSKIKDVSLSIYREIMTQFVK